MIFTIVLHLFWMDSLLPLGLLVLCQEKYFPVFMPENLQAGLHELFDVTMNDDRLPASKLRKWLMGNNEHTLPSRTSLQVANGVSSY